MLLQAVDELYHFFQHVSYQRIFPAMESFYDLLPYRLVPHDLFVVKYTAPTTTNTTEKPQNALAAHRDGSEFSFVIMLNDEYEGGGTHFLFSAGGKHVRPKTGGTVIFCGKNVHEAMPVTKGTRYLLAGFAKYAGTVPGPPL